MHSQHDARSVPPSMSIRALGKMTTSGVALLALVAVGLVGVAAPASAEPEKVICSSVHVFPSELATGEEVGHGSDLEAETAAQYQCVSTGHERTGSPFNNGWELVGDSECVERDQDRRCKKTAYQFYGYKVGFASRDVKKKLEKIIDRSVSKWRTADAKIDVRYKQDATLGVGVDVVAGSSITIHERGDVYTSVRDRETGNLLIAYGRNKKQGDWATLSSFHALDPAWVENRRAQLGITPNTVVVGIDENTKSGRDNMRLGQWIGRPILPGILPPTAVRYGDYCYGSNLRVQSKGDGTDHYYFACAGDVDFSEPCSYPEIHLTVKKSLIRSATWRSSCPGESDYSVYSTVKYSFKKKKAPSPQISFGEFMQEPGLDRGNGWSKFVTAVERTNVAYTEENRNRSRYKTRKQVRNKFGNIRQTLHDALAPAYDTLREAGLVDVDVQKKSRGRTVLEIASEEPDRRLTLWKTVDSTAGSYDDVVDRLVVEIGKDGTITKLRTIYEPQGAKSAYIETTFLGK